MSDTIMYSATLTKIECGVCHIPFALPESMRRSVQASGDWFWCPNGHKIRYLETEVERLRKKVQQVEESKEWLREQARNARNEASRERRRAAAARGQLTKMKNRMARGVCPAPGCKRSGFEHTALIRHLHDVHPDFNIPEEK